jgi:hypothetical protein
VRGQQWQRMAQLTRDTWGRCVAKLDKTMASLSPGGQEAMAGVTTIMNAKLEALIYAVNCTIRRR